MVSSALCVRLICFLHAPLCRIVATGYYNQCAGERTEWARGAGSHNDEGEGSRTNGKKAWRGMVVTVVGGCNNGRHSCVVGKAMAGPWVGIRPLLPSSTILLYVPNTRPYEGQTWQIYGGDDV